MSHLVVRIVLGLGALGAVFAYGGGQDPNLPVIGEILFTTPSNAAPWDKAFRSGLHDLGYIEGKNVSIVARYANGDASQVPALIQEMIALHVSVLWVMPFHLAYLLTPTCSLSIGTWPNPCAPPTRSSSHEFQRWQ